jgi:acyl dehydratase
MSEQTYQRAPGMAGLFARAGVAMVPGVSALPLLGGPRAADIDPAKVLVLEGAAVDRQRLAAYDRVCGFSLRETLPPTFPHMLAFPLHLALMTDPSFPFPAIGLVHIHNRITVHRPVRAVDVMSIRVHAGPTQPHPRGTQFAIHTQARVGEELVWEEVSTNLRRGRSEEGAPTPEVPSAEDLPATATWALKGDLGRRYAGVSGDYNPIHIHPLSARLFGFPSAIAHGMWTKARCLAALEPRLPGAYTVEVAFKRPIVLPTKVQFAARPTDDASGEARFGVRDAREGTPHLDGVVSPA